VNDGLDERSFSFQPIEGVRYRLNDAVPVTYVIELSNGGDI